MRKQKYLEILNNHTKTKCNSKGYEKTNLNKSEKAGLEKLKKRIESNELVIACTDKSSKFIAVKKETYIKMGNSHTKNYTVISRAEADGL